MRKATVLVVIGLAGTLASPAFADDEGYKDSFSGWRLGMWVGQEAFQTDVNYRGYTDTTDENRMSYGFFGGWALNKYFAAEVGYHMGGDFNAVIRSNGAFPTRNVEQHTEMRGFEGSLTAAWWISKQIGIYGRAGMYMWKGETLFTEDLNINSPTPPTNHEVFEDDGTEAFFGVGVQTVLDGALLRLEYQMAETADFQVPGVVTMRDSQLESLNLSVVWTLR